MYHQTEDLQRTSPSKTEGVLMVIRLCLLVPLASGEEVRQVLIEQECLDRAFTPRRIGDELALPVNEGFLYDAIDFEHRLEQVDVEPAPPAIDPHSRLYNAIASLSGVGEALLQSIPKKWERLDDLILFPKDAFQEQGWGSIIRQHPDFFSVIAQALNAARIGGNTPLRATKFVLLRSSCSTVRMGGWK